MSRFYGSLCKLYYNLISNVAKAANSHSLCLNSVSVDFADILYVRTI